MSNISTSAKIQQSLTRSDFGTWATNHAYISDKNYRKLKLKPNHLQQQFIDIVRWCRKNRIAVRIISLKPRQKGNSTIAVNLGYHDSRRKPTRVLIAGGEYDHVDSLWTIANNCVTYDSFEENNQDGDGIGINWGNEFQVRDRSIICSNGSTWKKETAEDRNMGRSWTFQFFIATECARWKDKGAVPADQVLAGALQCVPHAEQAPDSVVILESTGNGPQGTFYDRWGDAVTFEEFQQNPIPGTYIRVFSAWYEFDDSRRRVSDDERREIINNPTQWEREWFTEYSRQKISIENMAWYRDTLKHECGGDINKMRRDYPTTPEEAFSASSNRYFPSNSIDHQKSLRAAPDRVVLESTDEGRGYMALHASRDESEDAWIWEEPIDGLRYVLGADTAKGATQTGGTDPDAHSVVVIRDAYVGPGGRYNQAKVVARLPHGIRYDIDILEEAIWRLGMYYGGCMAAIEENMDGGLISRLKDRGYPNLYVHQEPNALDGRPAGAYGFRTTSASKRRSLELLKVALRRAMEGSRDGLEIPCKFALIEFENLIVPPKGTPEAARGFHDDDVMSTAIANICLPSATRFRRGVERKLSRVLLKLTGGRKPEDVSRNQYSL